MIEVIQGASPLVLGLPHTGTDVPLDIWERMNETGQALADTDWHIHDLYSGLAEEVTTVRTPIHRYVIDVNRDPAGISLYPGQNTTTLVPLTDFDGLPIWQDGKEPDEAEITRRRDAFHRPYHAALEAEMQQLKGIHGFAILYDCHSIRGDIPFLFEGRLPDFNTGTNLGKTCAPGIEAMTAANCEAAEGYSSVLNGRFKGGWTTRHYGRPEEGYHAIQMELAQATYCQESPPWTYLPERADKLRAHLTKVLTDLKNWRPSA
ncbi:N-formylglutamate deformylase HutG [Phaeobacter piscinae]|uniref:N-formylglutamate deformylase HutG n=1 Tax=Phaeobacter piscinae TaxID=1580596 RepID=A0ABM6PI51_9RHOB|nr:N-formylglutamate deformylase [Phaeobacter piscinae]ATG37538.1 N-formylglutamate deformylase HutG [Phaeobacter piscinae]AUQ88059.1 N-formylglutamate deformylase HutG [Phaeobacter piscinae]AUR25942.1 N-formylglutamate deformylase HutG [Phaeobacter piscinae]